MRKTGLLVLFMSCFALVSSADADYSAMSTHKLEKTLMEVITHNDEDKVYQILAHPNAKNFDPYSLTKALGLAAKNNYVNIARALIQAGAHIKERYSHALEDAAEKGYRDMVKILLPVSGCDNRDYSLCYWGDINYFNVNRDKALLGAAKNGHVAVMEELINAGADVNYENDFGQKVLIEATKNGHVEAVKKLIQAKVKVNAWNRDGETAPNIALYLRNVDLIREFLMAPGIDSSWRNKAQDFISFCDL